MGTPDPYRMSTRRRLAWALATVAVAGAWAVILLRGPAADAEDFATAADRICATAHDRLAQLPGLADRATIHAAAPAVVATTREAADELAALDPPAEVAAAWRDYVAGLRRQATTTAALLRAADAHDDAAVARLSDRLDVNSARAKAAGARLGAAACGGDQQTPAPSTPRRIDV